MEQTKYIESNKKEAPSHVQQQAHNNNSRFLNRTLKAMRPWNTIFKKDSYCQVRLLQVKQPAIIYRGGKKNLMLKTG